MTPRPVVFLQRRTAPTTLTRAQYASLYGDVRPTDDLVGAPTVGLTPDTAPGVLYLTSPPGQPIRRVRFDREVRVQFDGSRAALGFDLFQECVFRGPASHPAGDASLLNFTHAAAKGTAVDCTFRPQTPGPKWNAVNGHDFTNERFLIEQCVDGHGVYNTTVPSASRPYQSGVRILGGIARRPWFGPEPAQPDGVTHNDVILQNQGGRGTLVRGCLGVGYRDPTIGDQADRVNTAGQPAYYAGRVLSVVLFNDNVGDSAGFTLDRNWVEGAWFGVEAAGARASTPGTITGMRFDGTAGSGRDVNLSSAHGAVTTTGNVLYDGSPARVLRNG